MSSETLFGFLSDTCVVDILDFLRLNHTCFSDKCRCTEQIMIMRVVAEVIAGAMIFYPRIISFDALSFRNICISIDL